jgi:recombination protein RecT
MMPNNAQPPVRSAVRTAEGPAKDTVPAGSQLTVAQRNYMTIAETLKGSGGTEARAIRAMFSGDKALMDRFLAVAFSALSSGDQDILINSDPMTVVQAIKDAASLGLEPVGISGEGALVRYGRQAKFMPMWRGYVKRIRNSGKVQDVDCQLVYANDDFVMALGTEPGIHHVPILPPNDPEARKEDWRGDITGCYAWALMPSGKYIIEYMTTAELNLIRDKYGNTETRSGRTLPWADAWGEMARKTVIRKLAKRLPQEAVDQLLRVEAKSDEAAAEVRVLAAQANRDMAEVRQIALGAVGGTPRLLPGQPPANGEASSEAGQPEAQQAPGAGNVDAPTGGDEKLAPSHPDAQPG